MKFLAIIEGTVREALAKKTLLGMFIVSTLMILVCVGLFQIDAIRTALSNPITVHKGNSENQAIAVTFGSVLDFVWQIVTSILIYFSVLVGIFVSAGLITSIMEKGTIDLLLSKPVPRWQYVLGRFAGGTLIMFVEVAYLIIGLWLVAGFSLGIWAPYFLWNILMITLAFASAFSVVVLFAIITRSSWFAVIIMYALLIFASLLIPLAQFITRVLTGDNSKILTTVISVLRYSVPHIGNLADQTTNLILGKPVDVAVIFVAMGLTVIYLGLASYAFSRKQF